MGGGGTMKELDNILILASDRAGLRLLSRREDALDGASLFRYVTFVLISLFDVLAVLAVRDVCAVRAVREDTLVRVLVDRYGGNLGRALGKRRVETGTRVGAPLPRPLPLPLPFFPLTPSSSTMD